MLCILSSFKTNAHSRHLSNAGTGTLPGVPGNGRVAGLQILGAPRPAPPRPWARIKIFSDWLQEKCVKFPVSQFLAAVGRTASASQSAALYSAKLVAFSSSEKCRPLHQALQFRVVSGLERHKSILSQVHLLSVHNCLSPRQCVLQ